ncbi:unnamed protein product [Lupinus luteus]|uniref:Uncharacterized protein n=1 Tax=Lupinus luteus TaxID=3873 RepID=A0AAV1WJ94_LUPLU
MVTGNQECLTYLQSLAQKFSNRGKLIKFALADKSITIMMMVEFVSHGIIVIFFNLSQDDEIQVLNLLLLNSFLPKRQKLRTKPV